MVRTEAPRASTANSDLPGAITTPLEPYRVRRAPWWNRLRAPAYLLPALTVYALFVLWPLMQVGWLSLQQWDGYGPQVFVGLRNFADLWVDSSFRTALTQSVWWEIGAAVVPSVLGFGLALAVWRSRRESLLLAVLFFPVLLAPAVVAAIWVLVYSPLSGLLNTLLRSVGLGGLTRAWLGDPHLALPALFAAWVWSTLSVGTLLFWAGLRSISAEYLDLARVEGAGPVQRFRHVLLPGVRRAGVLALLINAALGAQVFDLIYTTTGGGPGNATMLLPLDMYGRAFGGRTGQGAAVAVFTVALGLLLSAGALLLLRRHEHMEAGDEPERTRRSTALVALPAVLVMLLPLGWMAVVAAGGGGMQPGIAGPGFDPRSWQWSNLSAAWEAGMGGAFETSLLLGAAVVALALLLAVPAAFALTRLMKQRAWRFVVAALLLIGLFQPAPVLTIPLFSLLKDLGLLDSVWGVVLPEVARTLPFGILVLWAFLAGAPVQVLEAAEVDGASPLQQLLRVALPLARPALFVVAVWSFVTSWDEYLLPTIVSQDGSLQTVPTLLATFIGRYDTQYGLLAAGALMAVLPALVIYLLLGRPAAGGLSVIRREVRE